MALAVDTPPDSLDEVGNVDLDVHKDIEHGNGRRIDGHQTTVAVVDHEIRAHGSGLPGSAS
jgi:hypothetical protein